MLNQSFSAENFRHIFDILNRKGIYLEADFFPNVAKITSELKQCKQEFKLLKREKSNLTPEDYQEEKDKINEKKDDLTQKKEKLLTELLEETSNKVNDSGFHFPISTITTKSGKTAYLFEHEPCSFFASKQVQYNIKKLYGVKQSNRDVIIAQLKKILGDTFPKIVIRTDIKGFYENISQKILLNKLNKDPLLTLSSKKIICKILQEYSVISGSDKGIPRGIGISAYLSELYLRNLDKQIKAHPDIIYYARYVDDIVAIFTPNPANSHNNHLDFIRDIASKSELELSDDEKTISIDLTTKANKNMDYLGYKLTFGTAETIAEPTRNKINRYKKRIDLSFDEYNNNNDEKAARKLLVKRLRFLTGNTRLVNNKRNALVGIYFSNSLVNKTSSFVGLDRYLASKISTLPSIPLKTRLSTMSFSDGFEFKRFSKYSEKDLTRIVSVWKNV